MSEPEASKEVSRTERFDELFKALVAALAVIAFCIQPALPFANPDRLIGGAGFLAGGITWCYVDFARRGISWWTAPGLLIGAFGLVTLANAMTDAGWHSRVNDTRCVKIERDMLSVDPRIVNGPEVFQALKCRPQTDADVSVPKSISATESRSSDQPYSGAAITIPRDKKALDGSRMKGKRLPTAVIPAKAGTDRLPRPPFRG